jgi:hypothetical protein
MLSKGANRRRQVHSVGGGRWFAAGEFFLVAAVFQYGCPATAILLAAAGTDRMYVDRLLTVMTPHESEDIGRLSELSAICESWQYQPE